jgi:hypothetical protein
LHGGRGDSTGLDSASLDSAGPIPQNSAEFRRIPQRFRRACPSQTCPGRDRQRQLLGHAGEGHAGEFRRACPSGIPQGLSLRNSAGPVPQRNSAGPVPQGNSAGPVPQIHSQTSQGLSLIPRRPRKSGGTGPGNSGNCYRIGRESGGNREGQAPGIGIGRGNREGQAPGIGIGRDRPREFWNREGQAPGIGPRELLNLEGQASGILAPGILNREGHNREGQAPGIGPRELGEFWGILGNSGEFWGILGPGNSESHEGPCGKKSD